LNTQSMRSVVSVEANPLSEIYSAGVAEEKRSLADPQDSLTEDTFLRSKPNVNPSENPEVIDCDLCGWPPRPSTQLISPWSAQGLSAQINADEESMFMEDERLEGHEHVLQTEFQQTKYHPMQCTVSCSRCLAGKKKPEVLHMNPGPSLPDAFDKNRSMPPGGCSPPEGTRVSAAQFAADLAHHTRKMQVADEIMQDAANRLWQMVHQMKSHRDHSQRRATLSEPFRRKDASWGVQ